MTHFKNLKEEEKYYREDYSGKLVGKTLEKIAMGQIVSEEFMFKYGDKPISEKSRNYKYWNRSCKDNVWVFFSEYQPLSLKFIEDNKELINFNALAYNKKLDVEVVKYYFEAGILKENSLSLVKLSEDYVESIFDKLKDKNTLVIMNSLSEEFIEKHISELDLTEIFTYDFIKEEFITKHYEEIGNTYQLARYRKTLSEDFFERHLEDYNNYDDFYNRHLSFDFYKRNKDKINWNNASKYITFEGEQLIEMKNYIQWFRYFKRYQRTAPIPSVLLDEMSQYVDLDMFVEKQDLDQWFIDKHYANLDASSVWEHQTLSEEFIRNNTDEIRWGNAYKQPNIPMDIIRENINRINDALIRRRLLDEDILDALIEKYVEDTSRYSARDCLKAIAYHQDFSPVFYKKYSKVLEKYNLEDNENLNETVKAKYIQKKKLSTMFKKN